MLDGCLELWYYKLPKTNLWSDRSQMRNELYETKISDARWYAYDLPGNIGWIAYLAGEVLIAVKQPMFLHNPALLFLAICAVIPAALMIVGIAELIHERIKKQERILPKWQLYLGFGALTLGGLSGMIVAGAALLIHACNGGQISDGRYLLEMCLGGLLCFIFAGLLFRGYKKRSF